MISSTFFTCVTCASRWEVHGLPRGTPFRCRCGVLLVKPSPK